MFTFPIDELYLPFILESWSSSLHSYPKCISLAKTYVANLKWAPQLRCYPKNGLKSIEAKNTRAKVGGTSLQNTGPRRTLFAQWRRDHGWIDPRGGVSSKGNIRYVGLCLYYNIFNPYWLVAFVCLIGTNWPNCRYLEQLRGGNFVTRTHGEIR